MSEQLEKIIQKYATQKGSLIPVLQKVQDEFGYVSREAVKTISNLLGYSESHIYGVLTFYAQFYLEPRGKHIIKACCGTACHVKGIEHICEKIEDTLNIKNGETTEDKLFTYEKIACMGACGLAPVVMVDDKVYGNTKPAKIKQVIKHIASEEK